MENNDEEDIKEIFHPTIDRIHKISNKKIWDQILDKPCLDNEFINSARAIGDIDLQFDKDENEEEEEDGDNDGNDINKNMNVHNRNEDEDISVADEDAI